MSAVANHAGVPTLAGTPKEVQAWLAKSHAKCVLALELDHVKPNFFLNLAENCSVAEPTLRELSQQRQGPESVERLADALVPRTPPSPRLLKEAAMLVRARKAVLESGDWLTAAQVAQLAGLSTRNPSAQPNKWKKQGLIFALNHGGADYFPGYGLNPETGFRPVKALAQIIETFAGHKDGWGMAYWFRSDNSFLGGKRPQDLLASAPERVLAAALDEVQEIAHG